MWSLFAWKSPDKKVNLSDCICNLVKIRKIIKLIYWICAGWSVWKKSDRNGCSIETVHIWPHVGKAKTSFQGGSFFHFQKNFYIFHLFLYNFSKKKTTAFQTPFRFTNMGSNMHRFSATAISFWLFSNGKPCTMLQKLSKLF